MRRKSVLWGRGFWAGVAGGAAAAIVLFAYRFITGMPTLQEALAERMILLLPFQVFALVLARLQHLAKPFGLAMAILTSVVGFGVGGIVYAWATRRSHRPRLLLGLLTAVITWLFLMFVFLPFIQGGILGMPLTTVVSAPALPMAVASLVYGLLLAVLVAPSSQPVVSASSSLLARGGPASPGAVSRRDVLRRLPLLVVAAAAGSRLAGRAVSAGTQIAAAAVAAFRLVKGMPSEITPNGQFYQVSKNFFDPSVDVAHWTLEVTGLVAKPLKLSYSAFTKAAPAVERYQTFECISNKVGGDLISSARWKGVRARDILALAGVKSGATTIIWRSADGYSESIPIGVVLDPVTLLAYEMNGEPLPQKHGAPVRVLMLNRYGMKQPKWLTSIEVADHDFAGYWEHQGWSKEAIVKTNCAFRAEVKEGGAMALGGWAFAGSRGISKVEVSADGGQTWFPAALKGPLGVNCWQFWSAEWTPRAPGDYTLMVRAVDGGGAAQPAEPTPTLPSGGQGYHTITIHFA